MLILYTQSKRFIILTGAIKLGFIYLFLRGREKENPSSRASIEHVKRDGQLHLKDSHAQGAGHAQSRCVCPQGALRRGCDQLPDKGSTEPRVIHSLGLLANTGHCPTDPV